MSKILVAYATNCGSTAEIAAAVAVELEQSGHTVDVCSLAQTGSLQEYDSLVVGAPMMFGWQSDARRFLKRRRAEIAGKKVACFASAMRLTRMPGETLAEDRLCLDSRLVSGPIRPDLLNIKNHFTAIGNCLQTMLQSVPQIEPVSVAFFKGKLELFRLNWWQAAFVMLVVQAVPGDYRNWDLIRGWGRSLSDVL